MEKTKKQTQATTIDEYIAGFPDETQKMLQELRSAIKKSAPEAEETIKYEIPTFTFNGNLVSFGAWKKHIGLYPVPRENEAFKSELSAYKGAKSTVQFPIGSPLPLPLIKRIVKFRVKQLSEKAALKGNKK